MSSDDEFAERWRDGDEKALRTAYDRHGAAVMYLAQRLLGNRADAEDVTQLTFVAAWTGRDMFDPRRGTMLGWLLGIARRKAVDRLRSVARDDRATETVRAQIAHRRSGRPPSGSSTGWSSPTNWAGCRTNRGAPCSWRSSTT